MDKKQSKVVYYAVWLIVAAALVYLGHLVFRHYQQQAYMTFRKDGLIWAYCVVPLLYGVHVALLEGLPKKFRMYWPLFILVFVPSFLMLIYPLSGRFIPHNMEIYQIATMHGGNVVFGMISGIALFKAVTSRETGE
ncbi:hypothetical protein JCM10914A_02660 [Paenibacillus sp. JCM 10914]|uniref:hypothetical protein n=1 Tax=Paenibacillus sp. JCM 10914 TaxID=1236974 RepID=UPI00055CCCAD|nr:hypothetical protein [Paenibacillus sp. JCM 10914]